MNGKLDQLTSELPDPESAGRFLTALVEQHPTHAIKLQKNEGLLSDVLTLAAYSPLMATTLLQNPDYLWWLNRKRRAPSVRTKDELLEALGRFMLTHSQLDLHTQLARFRRRELLRIFLSDIRRLATIAEITEDISNLADAILETALRDARQEMDNRYGQPQAIDEKGRKTTSEFCIVSLGKLGSRELNYSSDIDLMFLYSSDGMTSGVGSRGAVTNREYFVKLSEAVVQLVGKQVGEGAAYRVDTRLRPHGRVGQLAISIDDAVRYYTGVARGWERQVLIRSRSSAGDADIYKRFFEKVEPAVFVSASSDEPSAISRSFESVRNSKQLIDREQVSKRGFNVKLGKGGIREIEFIAQALQLAYGGVDRWLRAPHTLVSLSRLADRSLISEAELTQLFNSYEFLRRLEHVLQMENGLQTHTLPDEPDRRALVSRRMRYEGVSRFESQLRRNADNVHRIFRRVFGSQDGVMPVSQPTQAEVSEDEVPELLLQSTTKVGKEATDHLSRGAFYGDLKNAIDSESDYRHRLGSFRRRWSELIHQIADADRSERIDISNAKKAQTQLAEASIAVALDITRDEVARRYSREIEHLPLAVMGLGKLGGGAIDYGSDLDLVLVFDPDIPVVEDGTSAEFYGRVAEIFVTTLSSMTRDGSIYRVDLRLRPYGKNGTSAISSVAFADYMRNTAAIWEWLAYVKLRAVGGDIMLGKEVEREVREIIHSRAAVADPDELANETRRMRMLLEKERARTRRSKEVDLKYGPGGMLDVYFAMRYLQLRDNIPDLDDDRTSSSMLDVLRERGSLSEEDYDDLRSGYRFLSSLDHELRLAVGRTTRLPEANQKALESIARRLGLTGPAELIENLSIHRLNLRAAFDRIVGGAA